MIILIFIVITKWENFNDSTIKINNIITPGIFYHLIHVIVKCKYYSHCQISKTSIDCKSNVFVFFIKCAIKLLYYSLINYSRKQNWSNWNSYPNNIIVLSCYLVVPFGLTTSEKTTVSIKQDQQTSVLKM